jgi:hypothetical protein
MVDETRGGGGPSQLRDLLRPGFVSLSPKPLRQCAALSCELIRRLGEEAVNGIGRDATCLIIGLRIHRVGREPSITRGLIAETVSTRFPG